LPEFIHAERTDVLVFDADINLIGHGNCASENTLGAAMSEKIMRKWNY